MQEQSFGKLSAKTLSPVVKPTAALVLLHGVGSNEQNMLELGPKLVKDRLIVSLRAPLTMGPDSFAWFHVQFSANGPVHNWPEAEASLLLLEEALQALAKKTEIPLEKIAVFGFSQGAIMTLGLALQSRLHLEKYVAASGRTLPEFAQASTKSALINYKDRNVFVGHGINDSKLPISHARNTKEVLQSAKINMKYKEYPADHVVPEEFILDVTKWLNTP